MQAILKNKKTFTKAFNSLTDIERISKFLAFSSAKNLVIKFNGKELNSSYRVEKILKKVA